MNRTLAIAAIVLVAVVMVIGAVSPAMANEGSNGCDKANPNAQVCEKNPNADPCPPNCSGGLSVESKTF